MSIINDDKKALEGRKNTYKEYEVSPKDQVVKKLYKLLEEEDIGRKVQEAWAHSTANITAILERQQIYLKDLDEHIPASADQPFAGSSNLHLPMPLIVSKTYHARFLSAIMGVDPPFSAKARREDGTDRIQVVEDLVRFALFDWANKYRGIEEVVDSFIWNWVTTGTGIMKAKWLNDYTRFVDTEVVPVIKPPLMEGGEPVIEQKEQEVSRTIPCFSGPMYETVDLEDFRMIGGKGDPDLADIVMHRSFLTASELWMMSDQSIFDSDAVEKVIESGLDRKSSSLGASIKQQRDHNAGKSSTDTDVEADRYEVVEAYLRYDVDGSGITSDIIVWVHNKSGALLRATYLRRVSQSGMRPFAVAHFHKRTDQEYGVGLLEILHPLSVELDAMHNIRIDFGLITNNPVGFYRASSSLDPETLELEPGALIPVEDPQRDIYFPPRPNATLFGAQEEAAVNSYVEKLTGISELSLGIMGGAQGAARTASGVRALIGESNANLDVHLKRLNRAWKKVLRMSWGLIRTRVEPGFSFRVTGQDGKDWFRQVSPEDLMLDVDFDLSANSANSNKAVQTEVAQTLVGISSNPLYIQLGITGPNEAYNALKNYLSALGVKDVHRFIKKPAANTYTLTPEEEFQRVARGQQVALSPEMDHEGFIAFAQSMIDQQQQAQTLDDEQIMFVIKQMRAHQQMAEAIQQQQNQVMVQQQMQQNAAQSQQQAPAALNPLAGSAPGQLPGG